MDEEMRSAVAAAAVEAKALRRALHRCPEPAGAEQATAALLRRRLADAGLQVSPPFLATDVVATLDGCGPGPVVLLRADMDGLPLEETSGAPHASERPGWAHACGHDGHMAMVWGAGRVLQRLRARWRGTARLVFQPGEEVRAMARDLVAAGAMGQPEPIGAAALHGRPGLPAGIVSSRPGAVTAAAGFFDIEIRGKGGHGSQPAKAVNPIGIGAALIERLQRLPENGGYREPVVTTVCRFAAGTNANSIPGTATLSGTTRFLNVPDGEKLAMALEETVRETCRVRGAHGVLSYTTPYPPTRCAPEWVERLRRAAEYAAGPDGFLPLPASSMGADDFAYFLERIPGVYAYLGLGENHPPIHSPDFDFNDDVLATGIAVLAALVLKQP